MRDFKLDIVIPLIIQMYVLIRTSQRITRNKKNISV